MKPVISSDKITHVSSDEEIKYWLSNPSIQDAYKSNSWKLYLYDIQNTQLKEHRNKFMRVKAKNHKKQSH